MCMYIYSFMWPPSIPGIGILHSIPGMGSFPVDELLGFHSMHGMGWDGGWMTEPLDEIPHTIPGVGHLPVEKLQGFFIPLLGWDGMVDDCLGWDGVSQLWGLVVGSWAAR